MATYLVTGGCGFIGSHLIEHLLARGDRVRVLDDLSTGRRDNVPQSVEVTVGDVADAALVRRLMLEADGCFHLAAVASVQKSVEDWLGTHRANLTGAIAVFDAARRDGAAVPVVYASSAAVYGDNPRMPLAETAETRPLSAYGADKLGCELHARVAGIVHGVPAIGFRFFNVYGPRQDPRSPYSGVISIFADRIPAGQSIAIYGDGEQTRDFVFVGDVVRCLVAGMARPDLGGRVFNVCTGRTTTVNRLAATIGGIVGKPPQISPAPARHGDIRISVGDPSATIRDLGVTCGTSLADGLRTLLEYGSVAA